MEAWPLLALGLILRPGAGLAESTRSQCDAPVHILSPASILSLRSPYHRLSWQRGGPYTLATKRRQGPGGVIHVCNSSYTEA